MLNNMSREQLLSEIVCNEAGLYDEFNESMLLNDGYTYTTQELLDITIAWLEHNDECKHC